MKRCDSLINHPLYKEYLHRIAETEKDRIFCGHDMTHFLDTARIAYILILENKLSIEKPIIYAAALVHDIARGEENSDLCHDEASARFAEKILPECGFSKEETSEIASAVRSHRTAPDNRLTLGGILYTADKLSRRCFECRAYSECNWTNEKRNNNIVL